MNRCGMIQIVRAETADHFKIAGELFREYAGTLGFDLCFQDFDAELASLETQYAPPGGCLLLARCDGCFVGCVGLRYFAPGICEMKRLYIRPDCRGRSGGRQLAKTVVKIAASLGYERIRLDTLPQMSAANQLYKSLGFREIAPYRYNPIEGAACFELDLNEK